MKRIMVAVVLFPCVLLALRLTDYDVDQSSDQVLSTGFNYHLGMTGGDVVSNFGNASLNFERFQATLPSSYNLNLFGNLSANFEQDTLTPDTSDTDTTQQINYQIQWEAKYNKYLISGKDFLAFAKLEGDVLTGYDYPATQAIIGLGYGRFVSATPLARALRIEERMLAQGVLLDSLNLGTLMSFARELAPEAKRTYKERYYYWEREYYKSLESILNKSNLLHNAELGSAGSLIITDVLDEYISTRYYGYEVNLGVGYDLLPAYKATGRAAFASLAFDFAHPLGFRNQLIEKTNLRLPFTSGKSAAFSSLRGKLNDRSRRNLPAKRRPHKAGRSRRLQLCPTQPANRNVRLPDRRPPRDVEHLGIKPLHTGKRPLSRNLKQDQLPLLLRH